MGVQPRAADIFGLFVDAGGKTAMAATDRPVKASFTPSVSSNATDC